MKKTLLILSMAMMVISCFKEENWSAGGEVTQKTMLGSFHAIEINSVFDILLVQDTSDFALVTCGKNLIDNVVISQDNDLIRLNQKIGLNWARNYNRTIIELHFKSLSSIQINKSCSIEAISPVQSPELSVHDNSPVSELFLHINCTDFSLSVVRDNFGIYTISGKTRSSMLELDGSAHFKTGNLVSDSCNFIHKGIGDCFVNAKNVLVGKIIRNGSLMYQYYPTLKMQIENKDGKITRIN
jgi:hypothetical protein